MQTVLTTRNTEASIWERVIEPERTDMTADLARTILSLEFKEQDRKRMRELAEKAREGTVTPDEREEIANYERVGSFLSLMKAKARSTLHNGTG